MLNSKVSISILVAILFLGFGVKNVVAQTSESVLYVPLIGITSVPEPLALPSGPGTVTYRYAVKNFIREVPLNQVQVTDNNCSPVRYVEGDDNNDSELNYEETWRYDCTTIVSTSTLSIATAVGTANNITATHKAYATVVVGSTNLPPLVSVVNITKVAFPLSLPLGGGDITFTYRVNNPGLVPLSNVLVSDNKCNILSGKLGDTNGNNLLDINEVWVYTCSAILTETTTNTVHVVAYANNLRAEGEATITVQVATMAGSDEDSVPSFPQTGVRPVIKVVMWGVLGGIALALLIFFLLNRGTKLQ